MKITPAGGKLVIECHVGPQNNVYCIFDTESKSFETDIVGTNLVWYNDDITTAYYVLWQTVNTYDGSTIKDYDLAEDEYIRDLHFPEKHSKLIVTISSDTGTEGIDELTP